MNHITLTGVVTKTNDLSVSDTTGSSLLFHVADTDAKPGSDDIWFIILLQGKIAERLADDIWAGQIVTVFGRIRMQNSRENGAILLHAKDVIPHILDDDETEAEAAS